MVALRVGPLGSEGGVEGSFLSSATLFLVFFCDSFAVDVGNHLFYDITVLPTALGALCGVGVGGSGGLATFFSRFCASSCLTTCLRWKHPVSPFCFCPHSRFCPSNLVSPPSYTSFSGCRLQRAGQSRTAVFTHKNSHAFSDRRGGGGEGGGGEKKSL